MANDLVRFATGLESNLSQEAKEKGKILFAVTGDNKGYIYFDKDNNTRIKMSEHALTAEKDAANNTITTTYLKSIAQNSSTINTYSIKSIAGANTTKDIITIPNASTTKAGLITGEAQTLGGDKTFNNSVTINDKLTVNEDIISLAGEPYMAQKEYTNILCTANNDPNGYLYYGQLKLKDYYTEWYLKMYISMDIPYDSTKANTDKASYEGIVEYWGYANTITAYRIFNAHAHTSYRTFYQHVSYRPKLAGCQTYGHLLGFRFYSSWNPATTGYGRNIKIKIIHTDNCTFNFLDNMVLYANAPGTGSTNFDGCSEYDGVNNGLRESGDDNTRNHLIGAQYLKAGESCIDRYTIVMQEKGGDFSSICYKNATSNTNDTATNHIKSTSHYVVGGPVYYAYNNAHTNAGALSSSQEFHTNYPLDFRYTSNSGASLINGQMVYLKFEKDSEGYLTIPDHPWYSQELPTEEDGYVYMSLGVAYSTSNVYMFPEHEYYEYIAGQIRKYVHNLPVKQGGTGKTSWTPNQIIYASAATTLSQLPSGTDGQLLKSKGTSAVPEWISPSSLLVGKATGDSAGDNIRSTYIKSLSVSGTTLTITKGDNSTSTLTLQDTNTDTKVTNTLNTTTKAYVTGTTSATTNTGTQVFDTGVYLDTTAGQLVATKFVGALQGNADTATKATGDSAGDNIRSTYIKGLSVNGLTLTVTKGDNSSSTLTLQDLDVKVNMKARGTTKAYLLGTTTSPTSSDQAVTSVAETGVYFDTTAGKLVATTFKGALEGNADTATALKNGHTFKITDDSSTNTGNTVAFNGTQDVTLKLPADVKFSNITATSNITVNTGNIDIVNVKEADKFINLYYDANKTSGASWRLGHIGSGSGDTNYFVIQSGTSATGTTEWHNVIRLGMNSYDAHFGGNVNPLANNAQTLGTTSLKWKNVYATTFTGDLTGTATKAIGDSAGDNIRSTYIKSLSVNGTTLTITKGDSTTSTITLQDTNTDTKVTNTLNTTAKAYITGTTSATTNTGTQVFDTGVYLDTTAGQLVATTFKGNLAWTYLTSVPTLVKSAYGTAATDKYTIQLYNQNGATIASTTTVTTNGVITIPAATTSQAGLITSTDQSIAGSKTFTGASTTIGRNIIRNTTDAPDQGDIILSVFGYKTGYPVYTDPLFESGTNSVSVYNNSSNGNVTVTRDTYTNFGITSPGTNSNYVLRVQNVGTASPNLGGFVQSISSRANAQFVQIFRALVPVGYTLSLASNSMGTNYKEHWITSNAGTGKWEWYARRVLCGKEGTFSSGGHISISGTPAGTTSAPVSFYLSYCQLYDLTKAEYDGLRTRYADNADSATSATKATNDGANNQITTTYLKAVSITGNDTTDTNGTTAITAGSKGFYTVTTGANASTKYALPIAGESVAGIIVNTAQTWKGVKTFSTGVTVSATGGFEYSGIETGTSAGARPVWYSYLGKNGRPVIDASHFTYNPGTQTLNVANMSGLAAKATADAANNTITTTYIKHGSIEVSDANHNMTYTNGANGDTKTVSLPFVKLSGDTMTGDLLVQKTSGDTKVGVKNNNGNVELLTSTNRGVYDRTTTSWIVYRAPSGAITYLLSGTGTKSWQFNDNGNLTTPAGATATANLIGTASRAVGDSAGNQITTTYAKAGSFATDTTNHKITYTDGANTAKEFSAPFVLRAGDSMTGNLTTTGNMTAVKFIGALQGNADSASTLSHKALNNTTLENTAGSFAFSGSGLPWDGTDWIGLQIGDSADKFQITANDGGLLFRQNDSGGTATSGWTSWTRLAYAPMNTQVGSSTKGIYVSNKGALTACDYELKATVNNATQYGVAYYSTTTNITSTAAGGANTALMGKGSAAPTFVSVSPTLTLTAGTTAGPKVKITVLGVAGTDLQLPSAGSGASGVVTTDTQTFAGAKTFNNSITINGNVDSTDSLSTSASVVVKGGVSVAKNLSAKTIRIDNNQTTEGVQLQYDETLDTLNFVFV